MVRALEEFKTSVYGDNYEEENKPGTGKPTEASKKQKAIAEFATKECENYDWCDLADTGKVNIESYFMQCFFMESLIKFGISRRA